MSRWEEALEIVARERGHRLLGTAYLLCGNVSEAQDLVQEAFVRTFSRRAGRSRMTSATHGTDADPAEAEAYLRRAITTAFLDSTRRTKVFRSRRHLIAAPDAVPGPEHQVTLREDLARALAALSPRERTCVTLRYFSDLTVAQVAAELDLAEGSVKRYLSDATKKLRLDLIPAPDPGAAPPAPRPFPGNPLVHPADPKGGAS